MSCISKKGSPLQVPFFCVFCAFELAWETASCTSLVANLTSHLLTQGVIMSYRNVLLLIADDWSPIAGCYGNDIIKMPSVDALAARGTLFKHAFCTHPIVRRQPRQPAHRALQSHARAIRALAQHPQLPHATRHAVNFQNTTMLAGFTTGVVGKLHVQPESVYPWKLRNWWRTQRALYRRQHLKIF